MSDGVLSDLLRGIRGETTDEEQRADRRRAEAGTLGGHLPTSARELGTDLADAGTEFRHAIGADALAARLAQLGETGSLFGDTHEASLARSDAEAREASRRSPIAGGAGAGGGDVAPFAIPAGAGERAAAELLPAAAEETIGLLPRAARSAERIVRGAIRPAVETGLYSTAVSRATTPEDLATDAATGELAGGVLGGTATTLGELLGAGASRMSSPAARRVRASQRLAAPGGARALGASDEARWASLPGGLEGQADRLRAMGVPRFLDTPADIAERAAQERARAFSSSRDIRDRFEEAGGSVPLSDILDAIEGVATEAERSPELRHLGIPSSVRSRGAEYARGMGTSFRQTADAQAAEAELRELLDERLRRGSPQSVADLMADMPRVSADIERQAAAPPSTVEEVLGETGVRRPPIGPTDAPIGEAGTLPGPTRGMGSSTNRVVTVPRWDRPGTTAELPMTDFPWFLTPEAPSEVQDLARFDLAEAIRAAESRLSGPSAAGVTLSDLERELELLGRQTGWVTPQGARMPVADEVLSDLYGGLRGAGDEAVARTLPEGTEAAERFRQSRLDTQTAGEAERQAQQAVRRSAGPSIVGGLGATSATAAGTAVGGAPGGVAARVAYELGAPRLPAMRTVAMDALASAVDRSAPSLARWRPLLERARRTGTLALAHLMLSREPEYVAAVEQATHAETAAPTAAPTARDERRRAARRELARRELARRAAAR